MLATADVFHFEDRIRRSFGFATPNYAGAMLATMALLWITLPGGGGRQVMIVRAIAIAGTTALLMQTYSRGAILGLAAGGLTIVVFSARGVLAGSRRRVLAGLLALAIAVAGMGVWNGFWRRAALPHLASDASVGNRVTLWQGALQAIGDRPWSGWGFARSGIVYTDLYQPLGDSTRPTTPVNGVLTVGMELGLPVLGLVLVLACYPAISALGRAPSALHPLQPAIAVACVVLLVCNVSSTLGLGWVFPAAYLGLAAASVSLVVSDFRAGRGRPLCLSAGAALAGVLSLFMAGRWAPARAWFVQGSAAEEWTLTKTPAATGREPAVAAEVLLLLDRAGDGDLSLRDVRSFLAANPWIRTCTVRFRLGQDQVNLANDSEGPVIASGDWIPRVARELHGGTRPWVALHPRSRPAECGLAADGGAAPREIVLPPVDLDAVEKAWSDYAAAVKTRARPGELCELVLDPL